MNSFYCSDHHLSHYNIIKFCNRPFSDEKEMNEALLENHNKVVRPSDHVSFLGDVTLRRNNGDVGWFIKEMRKYNGHKRLYLGNHDHFPIKVYLDAGFEKVYATWRTEVGVLLSHIPIHPSSMGSAIANVHGHIHNIQAETSFPPVMTIDRLQRVVYRPYVNVSMEAINYTPISFDEVMVRIRKGQGSGEYAGVKVGKEVIDSPKEFKTNA